MIYLVKSNHSDCLINILREKDNTVSEKDNLVQTVSQLCYSFVEDVCKRTKQMDTQYLLGLQKFFTIYLDTVSGTEPELSATPKLSSLLHTYF